MHNVGHGYEGDFIVVDTVAEARRRIADKGIQEFSLIHDLEGGRIAPSRLIVQKDVPVRLYNTTLQGAERVSVEPFVMPGAPNIRDGVITTIEFTPDVAGEFTIRYDNHVATATLIVESGVVEPSPGDANGDGMVNVADLRIVAAALGTSDSIADLNRDGLVDIRDLVLVAVNFGRGAQPVPVPTPTPVPTSTSTPGPKPTPTPVLPNGLEIQATNDLEFVPPDVTIRVGDTVRWTNVGVVPHSIAFDDPGITGDDFFEVDETHTVAFTRSGVFRYVCEFHPPNMVGTVTVVP